MKFKYLKPMLAQIASGLVIAIIFHFIKIDVFFKGYICGSFSTTIYWKGVYMVDKKATLK